MASINPIGGINTPGVNLAASGATGKEQPGGTDFGQLLRKAIDGVENGQAQTTAAMQDLLSGQSGDVLPVVSAVAKADLSFKLLLNVRNKVIEAYKQTMNMQV
jgi:flagellar hook-basal body complex protein FliE